jgi:hypothetical protein
MISRQPFPRPGDKLLHSTQRELVRHLQAARQIAGEGGLQVDLTGTGGYVTAPKAPAFMLAEIVDNTCAWKQEERSSGGWPYQWHYTVGRTILYYYSDGTWAVPTPPTDDDGSSSSSGILDEYIIHPTGYPEPLAENLRLHDAFWPLYSLGDWVWCIWEAESGLWAIHDGYESWIRFELAENLTAGGSALAYLVQCQSCPPGECQSSSSSSSGQCDDDASSNIYEPNYNFAFCVYDGLNSQDGIVGQRGYAKFFAESRRFEVVSLAQRTFWRFELAEDLEQWATEPVRAYRRCYDASGYGQYVTDCNQEFLIADWSEIGYFGYASEGATGVCEMHRCEAGQAGYRPGWVGVITDLRCPLECLCGEQGPDAHCEEAASSSSSSSSGE